MEETTPPEQSKSVLVLSLAAVLVEGGQFGELVLPSLPRLVRRTEEREEFICGTELTGRQNSAVEVVSVESGGGEEQEGG